MSGGEFQYAFTTVNQFVDDLDEKLNDPEWVFSPKVKKKLGQILKQAIFFSETMRQVEWLYSGDTGEDTFLERIKTIEKELKNRK